MSENLYIFGILCPLPLKENLGKFIMCVWFSKKIAFWMGNSKYRAWYLLFTSNLLAIGEFLWNTLYIHCSDSWYCFVSYLWYDIHLMAFWLRQLIGLSVVVVDVDGCCPTKEEVTCTKQCGYPGDFYWHCYYCKGAVGLCPTGHGSSSLFIGGKRGALSFEISRPFPLLALRQTSRNRNFCHHLHFVKTKQPAAAVDIIRILIPNLGFAKKSLALYRLGLYLQFF